MMASDIFKNDAFAAEMQNIQVNIMKIEQQVNATSRIYKQDLDEMRSGIDKI